MEASHPGYHSVKGKARNLAEQRPKKGLTFDQVRKTRSRCKGVEASHPGYHSVKGKAGNLAEQRPKKGLTFDKVR